MRVGIDVDDVLLDTLNSAWLPTFNRMTNNNLKPTDITDWNITKFIDPKHHKLIYDILNMSRTWEMVEPIKGSQEYLKKINDDKDIELFIVSATSTLTPNTKWEKFFEYFSFIDPKQVILIHNKELLKLDLLVDDNPNNLQVYDILFSQPHNNNYDWVSEGLYKVNNWKEVYDIIQERK